MPCHSFKIVYLISRLDFIQNCIVWMLLHNDTKVRVDTVQALLIHVKCMCTCMWLWIILLFLWFFFICVSVLVHLWACVCVHFNPIILQSTLLVLPFIIHFYTHVGMCMFGLNLTLYGNNNNGNTWNHHASELSSACFCNKFIRWLHIWWTSLLCPHPKFKIQTWSM